MGKLWGKETGGTPRVGSCDDGSSGGLGRVDCKAVMGGGEASAVRMQASCTLELDGHEFERRIGANKAETHPKDKKE